MMAPLNLSKNISIILFSVSYKWFIRMQSFVYYSRNIPKQRNHNFVAPELKLSLLLYDFEELNDKWENHWYFSEITENSVIFNSTGFP